MLRRLGVGGRLLIAFFSISGFAVLGAATGIVSFLEIDKSLEWITQRKVPTALVSQELSRQAEKIVAAAPKLLTVSTPEDQGAISDKIAVEVRRLEALLYELEKQDVTPEAVGGMASVVDRLRTNLSVLDDLISERLRVGIEKKGLLTKLVKSASEAQLLLEPWILVMDAKVVKWRKASADSGLTEADRQQANSDLETSLAWFRTLQHMRILIATVTAGLQQAASADHATALRVASFRLKKSLSEARRLVAGLDPKLRPLMGDSLEEFEGYIGGEKSIPKLRTQELDLIAKAEQTLQENSELSQELTAAVDTLVDNANRDIAAANRDVETVRRFSTWALTAAVVLSLVSSILIVWLYVGRNIVARLTALSESMSAIAGGNLRAPLPPSGDGDEIGGMAKALIVFRDTAIEVEKSNLREISEARRRLTDAIESISEGFSLYDTEDRLVVCNSTYSKILYAGIEDIVTPGTQFETIIRSAAERGLVADAEGRVEEWVAERLARHRNPTGSHLQLRDDERWILINERKTDDGGTVAVYADITELKQREEELSGKSTALEQLSNQLAKYLSPQVYDSIFSGRQEVKVESSRKKLTVFFSDIAGFTETADRLESEELTQLLNHYLTEMSRIALDHGATIDKYVGDAILIFFGDPETKGVKEDALACVEMAIAMRNRLYDLEDIWRQSGIEKPLRCRMGIHTGFCTVGNFGSEDRMDYTIIGGAVNTASRLETLATPGEILISFETFTQIRDQIHCEEHGETEVKGIAYPVATYQVIDTYETLGRQRRRFREEHPTGKLELDIDAMTTDDRNQVLEMLRRAQALLSQTDVSDVAGTSAANKSKQKNISGS
jgi:class 3 adenylate cyclase/methyl-accepting chemotaxis protein